MYLASSPRLGVFAKGNAARIRVDVETSNQIATHAIEKPVGVRLAVEML
jgi:hypothetical protein